MAKLRWIHKIEVSSHCNFTCVYCPNTYGLGYGKGNMRMETFTEVVRWAGILNPTGQPVSEPFVWLHGIGEPLLNKNLTEFVSMLSSVTPCGFSTNGEILTAEKIHELDDAGLAYLCVSNHDPEIASEAIKRIKNVKPRFDYSVQRVFNDDWAGQLPPDVKIEKEKMYFRCSHIETGGAHIIYDGRIVNCCIDAQGYPILGSVHDSEIRHIDIEPIPLCKNCRNFHHLRRSRLAKYSKSLSEEDREEMFFKQVAIDTLNRNIRPMGDL